MSQILYGCVHADPPWWFRDKAHAGQRGAEYKYPCMRTPDICALDVPSLCAPDCLLAMWWVDTMPLDALEVCNAWGFRLFKMNGLIWRKTTKSGKQAFGMGHVTRADSESVLFGVRGKLSNIIRSHAVRQSFYGELREHSRKPEEAAVLLEQLVGDVPMLEMFARRQRPGWDLFGNEVDGSIEIPVRFAPVVGTKTRRVVAQHPPNSQAHRPHGVPVPPCDTTGRDDP